MPAALTTEASPKRSLAAPQPCCESNRADPVARQIGRRQRPWRSGSRESADAVRDSGALVPPAMLKHEPATCSQRVVQLSAKEGKLASEAERPRPRKKQGCRYTDESAVLVGVRSWVFRARLDVLLDKQAVVVRGHG
jgi:hypothetical protein